jgi:aspartate/methionine/tyrosine aminotransferase
VVTPCYQSLLEIPKIKGCTLTTVELKEEQQWRLNFEAVARAITPKTKCMVINFPHNPTGQVITQEELQRLITLLDKHGIWLFSDEVYRLLAKPSTPWALPAAEIYPRALSLGVMSKAFGMAGLRVGWIACQDHALLKKIEQIKHYTSICNSAPAELLSLISLSNKDTILNRNNAIVSENLALLDAFFSERSNLFSWVRPQGGCVGLVQYKKPESVNVFCDRLVQEAGILLLPASVYDTETNHFRIGFGRTTMPEVLDRFKHYLDQ